jgi:polysaccharide export outer membrane protein
MKKVIAQRLATYVKIDESAVSVEVSQINSYRVTVNGNIASPGVLQAARYLTVGEAISLAGGPNQYSSPSEAVIVRTRPNGRVDRIPIRYDLLIEGRALEQDIVLLSGDLVYVP